MANPKKHQFTFSGGEVAPTSLGRHDIERFQSSCETMRNWVTKTAGGVENRAGFEYFGDERIQLDSLQSYAATAVASTDPNQFTDTAHGLATGDNVIIWSDTVSVYDLVGVNGEIEVIDDDNFVIVGSSVAVGVNRSVQYYKFAPSQVVRCIDFTFKTEDTYALYFSDRWMMVARNGALVFDSASTQTITNTNNGNGNDLILTFTPGMGHEWISGDEVWIDGEMTTGMPADHGNKKYTVFVSTVGGATGTATDVSNANPAVVLDSVQSFDNGDLIKIDHNSGMPELSYQEYRVRNRTGTTFELEDIYGDPVDSTDYGSWTVSTQTTRLLGNNTCSLLRTGGPSTDSQSGLSINMERFFRMPTPWSASDLKNMDFDQTEDTLTITCDGFEAREITRSAHDVWTISVKDFRPNIEPPASVVEETAGTSRNIMVTSVSRETGEESYAQEAWCGLLIDEQPTWPEVDEAFEYNVYHMPLNSFTPGFDIVATSASAVINTTASENPDTTIRPPEINNPFEAEGTPVDITGVNVTGADQPIRILAVDHGLVTGQNFLVRGITGNGPIELNNRKFEAIVIDDDNVECRYTDRQGYTAWTSDGGSVIPLLPTDNPTAVAYDQQRLILASTALHPRAIYMTRSRSYNSMNVSIPPQPDDAISLELAGKEANKIRWLVPMSQVLVLTSGSVYALQGNDNGIFVPSPSPYAVRQYGGGAGLVKPVVVGTSVIYIADRGSAVMELSASSDLNAAKGFVPSELSALAPHLVKGVTNRVIVEMAYAEEPNSVIWLVRDDGILIGLTFKKEFNQVAFHRHDTPGNFESVCAVSEGQGTGTYVSVKRTINGRTRRYFERLDDRDFVDVQDAFFVDSGLKYDEPFPATVKIGDRTTFTMTLAAGHTFVDGDLFDIEHKIQGRQGIVAGGLDGIRYKVDNKTATTIDGVTLVDAVVDVTTELAGVDTVTLVAHRCTQTVTGLDHLIGESVSILGDGSVKDSQVVTALGELDMSPDFHSRIVAGLAIEADLETLPADGPGGPFQSLEGSFLKLEGWSANLYRTRGLQVGSTSSSTLEDLEWRTDEALGHPTRLQTGVFHLPVEHDWNEGQLFIRQPYPLPATILSLTTKLEEDSD